MRIRPAELRDVPAIRALLHDTWLDTYSSVAPVAILEEVTAEWHAEKKLRREIASGDTFWLVAEGEDEALDGVLSAHVDEERVVQLGRLYVAPLRQRSGIGHALLAALEAAHPDAPAIRLEVEEKNPKGCAFYRKHGFLEVERVRHDIGPVEAYCLILEKVL